MASKHATRAPRRGEESSSSWLIKKSWGTIQRGWRSVHGGCLGDACMKASGDRAGTKAGLGVEELRADKTQEPATQRRLRKTYLTLPVLTQYLCVQAGERKVRGGIMRGCMRYTIGMRSQESHNSCKLLLKYSPPQTQHRSFNLFSIKVRCGQSRNKLAHTC